MNVEEIVAAYDHAWNEPDPAERRRLLELSWAEDGELVDPTGRFQSREAIGERLAGFPERFPGARVGITSRIDEHHGFMRYAWAITDADGATLLEGIDVCELAADGRLQRVVMFFGPLPKGGLSHRSGSPFPRTAHLTNNGFPGNGSSSARFAHCSLKTTKNLNLTEIADTPGYGTSTLPPGT